MDKRTDKPMPVIGNFSFWFEIYKKINKNTFVADISIDQVVSLCCNEGEQWGVEKKHCSSFDNRVDVADELQGLCLSTVEICCSKQHQIFQCAAGQTAAKNELSCLSQNSSTTGSDFFKVSFS